jgi:hypothetical protein
MWVEKGQVFPLTSLGDAPPGKFMAILSKMRLQSARTDLGRRRRVDQDHLGLMTRSDGGLGRRYIRVLRADSEIFLTEGPNLVCGFCMSIDRGEDGIGKICDILIVSSSHRSFLWLESEPRRKFALPLGLLI